MVGPLPSPVPAHADICFPPGNVQPPLDVFRLDGMNVRATSIGNGGDGENACPILAVGEDHSLWCANYRSKTPRFVKVRNDLPN
jgi:hypothetical protein